MAEVKKVGVAWIRKFSNGKEGIKISIKKKIYIAYKNTQKENSKNKQTCPDFVVVEFVDFSQNMDKSK